MISIKKLQNEKDIQVEKKDYGYYWEEEVNRKTVTMEIYREGLKTFSYQIKENGKVTEVSETLYTVKQCKNKLVEYLKKNYGS